MVAELLTGRVAWDSTRVASNRTTLVAADLPNGTALPTDTSFAWAVQVGAPLPDPACPAARSCPVL